MTGKTREPSSSQPVLLNSLSTLYLSPPQTPLLQLLPQLHGVQATYFTLLHACRILADCAIHSVQPQCTAAGTISATIQQ